MLNETVTLIYLVSVNIITFFMFGIDKWKAKRSRWRIPEATLLAMAAIGGSLGAWLGMKVWHHKTLHKKFRFGIPLILIVQIALLFFCACRTANSPTLSAYQTEQEYISGLADKVWTFSKEHPQGFTLDIRTMKEPKEGIAVSYAATQNCCSRNQLDSVINHALQNDGYVGGWYNSQDSLYYFDSSRLFPEDAIKEAIQFGKENGQRSVFILSTSTDIPIMK